MSVIEQPTSSLQSDERIQLLTAQVHRERERNSVIERENRELSAHVQSVEFAAMDREWGRRSANEMRLRDAALAQQSKVEALAEAMGFKVWADAVRDGDREVSFDAIVECARNGAAARLQVSTLVAERDELKAKLEKAERECKGVADALHLISYSDGYLGRRVAEMYQEEITAEKHQLSQALADERQARASLSSRVAELERERDSLKATVTNIDNAMYAAGYFVSDLAASTEEVLGSVLMDLRQLKTERTQREARAAREAADKAKADEHTSSMCIALQRIANFIGAKYGAELVSATPDAVESRVRELEGKLQQERDAYELLTQDYAGADADRKGLAKQVRELEGKLREAEERLAQTDRYDISLMNEKDERIESLISQLAESEAARKASESRLRTLLTSAGELVQYWAHDAPKGCTAFDCALALKGRLLAAGNAQAVEGEPSGKAGELPPFQVTIDEWQAALQMAVRESGSHRVFLPNLNVVLAKRGNCSMVSNSSNERRAERKNAERYIAALDEAAFEGVPLQEVLAKKEAIKAPDFSVRKADEAPKYDRQRVIAECLPTFCDAEDQEDDFEWSVADLCALIEAVCDAKGVGRG
jgi:hypothetical protein